MSLKIWRKRISEIAFINKAIFGLLLVALLFWAAMTIFFTEKDIGTAKTTAELSQLANNIRKYYQNRPDFWGLSTQTVIEKKIAPLAMLQNNSLQSYYKTPVLVGSAPDGTMLMPGAKSFDIIYKDLNKQQCEELASYRFDDKFWLGVMSLTLDNGSEAIVFNWIDKNLLPIKKEQAKNVCMRKNTLIWHYE